MNRKQEQQKMYLKDLFFYNVFCLSC